MGIDTQCIDTRSLYGVLKTLERQGLIETIKEEKGSRKKKTYRITEQGKEALHTEFNRYQSLIQFTKKIMNEKGL